MLGTCSLSTWVDWIRNKSSLLVLQEHRHSYVRKNAVFAVLTLYRDFESLLPDAPELIQIFLAAVCSLTSTLFLLGRANV